MFFQELEDMVNKMKNEKEKDLIIENRFHKPFNSTKDIQDFLHRIII